MLNDRFPLYADNNHQWGFVIDWQKGVYVDSSAMSKQQYTKYYRTQSRFQAPHLNYSQACQFSKYYILGQKLLYVKMKQNIAQITRLIKTSSHTYITRHLSEIFGPSFAISKLAQLRVNGGYLRTDEERQKIHDYGKKRFENAMDLGLIPTAVQDKDSAVNRITNILRSRYLSTENKVAAAPAQAQAQA